MSEPPRHGPSSESPESNSKPPERVFDTEQFKAVPPPAGPPRLTPPPGAASPSTNFNDHAAGPSASPAELLDNPQTIALTDLAPNGNISATTQMPGVAPINGEISTRGRRPFGISPSLLFIGVFLTAAVLVAVIAAAALSVRDDLSNEVAVAETSLIEFSTVSDSSLPELAEDLPGSPTVTRPLPATTTSVSTSSSNTSAPAASTTTVAEQSDSFGPGSSASLAPSAEPPTTARPSTVECDPNYGGCVPIGEDVDCVGDGDGPLFQSWPVSVTGNDIYDLDPDNNQIACG